VHTWCTHSTVRTRPRGLFSSHWQCPLPAGACLRCRGPAAMGMDRGRERLPRVANPGSHDQAIPCRGRVLRRSRVHVLTAKIIDIRQLCRRKIAHNRDDGLVFVTYAAWPEPISAARFQAELDRMWAMLAAFGAPRHNHQSSLPRRHGSLRHACRRLKIGGTGPVSARHGPPPLKRTWSKGWASPFQGEETGSSPVVRSTRHF
jgi:hypothetical protein